MGEHRSNTGGYATTGRDIADGGGRAVPSPWKLAGGCSAKGGWSLVVALVAVALSFFFFFFSLFDLLLLSFSSFFLIFLASFSRSFSHFLLAANDKPCPDED